MPQIPPLRTNGFRVGEPYEARSKHILEENEQNETIYFAYSATCKAVMQGVEEKNHL